MFRQIQIGNEIFTFRGNISTTSYLNVFWLTLNRQCFQFNNLNYTQDIKVSFKNHWQETSSKIELVLKFIKRIINYQGNVFWLTRHAILDCVKSKNSFKFLIWKNGDVHMF